MPLHHVRVLLYPGFAATDAVGPADVLTTANQMLGRTYYRLEYVAPTPDVVASNGMRLQARRLPRRGRDADTLVVPGADEGALRRALGDATLVRWIRAAALRASRVCSVCSGAFLLAEAGLLDGCRAASHWRGVSTLAAMYPALHVDAQALFVEDGRFWTSAGVSAGIDMMLAIVERDLGRDVAIGVAREMVLFLVRAGGQSQFSAPLDLQARARHTDLRELAPWIEARLPGHITVAAMASAMAMSERTLHRRCSDVFGMTPLGVVQRLKLEHARSLLVDASLPLKQVAVLSGLGDVSRMGKVFKAALGVTPTAYRRRFTRFG